MRANGKPRPATPIPTPSGETEQVLAVMRQTIQRFGYVSEVGSPGLLRAIAADLVRRYPGLTRRPMLPGTKEASGR